MNYTTNLHLPIIPSSQYSTTRVVDMIAANQGDSASSAFNIIDTAVAGKQDQITVNPTGETATETITTMKIDGVVYNVTPVITIDSALSMTSTNPVENRVVTNALNNKQEQLTVNPTGMAEASLEKLTIDGVIYNIISATTTVDNVLSMTSTNPVENRVITNALNGKQDQLTVNPAGTASASLEKLTIDGVIYNIISATTTVDDALSTTSTNPVENRVITNALDNKQEQLTVNPTGTPEASLEKVTIDGVIYNISSATTTVDDALSTTSTNPVENRVITNALNDKVDSSTLNAMSLKISDQLSQDPSAEIAQSLTITVGGASTIYNLPTQIIVDDALSPTSTNPVQNGVITTELNLKVSRSELDDAMDSFAFSTERMESGTDLGSITIGTDVWNIPEIKNITVDDALSPTSTNPVQNGVITTELNLKVSRSELDDAMDSFAFSTERMESGTDLGSITIGTDVWNIPEIKNITVDDEISSTSENPVQNKVIKSALDLKLNAADADDISITLSENRSPNPSALTLQCVIFNDSSGTTIYNMPDIEAIIDEKIVDFEFMNAESVAEGVTDAYGVIIDNKNIYNFRDGRIPGLFTVGYNYTTPVASGDVIADTGLIAAYNAHMPITINGWLLSYQNVSGNDVRYLTATLSGNDVLSRIVVFNTSTNVATFYETAGSGGGSTVVVNPTLGGTEPEVSGLEVDGVKYAVITTQDVQSMIDTAISNALKALS